MATLLLYPCDSLNTKVVDEDFAEELAAAKARGREVALVSTEALEQGSLRVRPEPQRGDTVLYRGWMLTPLRYRFFVEALQRIGVTPFTTADQYQLCHHLPCWYSSLADLTAETVVLEKDSDFEAAFAGNEWPGYFVKDYVKSLSTAGGSLVDSPSKIADVVALIERYRGFVEGGVCVRKKEDFLPGTESRHFVFKGRAYSASGEVPSVVAECAARIQSPFFSVDTATTRDGVIRVVEIGDGQVSARKEWDLDRFMHVVAT